MQARRFVNTATQRPTHGRDVPACQDRVLLPSSPIWTDGSAVRMFRFAGNVGQIVCSLDASHIGETSPAQIIATTAFASLCLIASACSGRNESGKHCGWRRS